MGDASPMALTAVEALQYSSNTYMMQLAMRMLGAPYTAAGQYLNDSNRVKVYEQFRKAFASYGLGASTGFDIPGESTGYLLQLNLRQLLGSMYCMNHLVSMITIRRFSWRFMRQL